MFSIFCYSQDIPMKREKTTMLVVSQYFPTLPVCGSQPRALSLRCKSLKNGSQIYTFIVQLHAVI